MMAARNIRPPMIRRVFPALLCLIVLLAPLPAAAQFFSGFQPPEPTAPDVDPGVDHTALDKQLARSS
jgi:hypothetical protein